MAGLDFAIITDNLSLFMRGFGVTILISAIAIPLAIVFGGIVALCRLSSLKGARIFGTCYVEVLRNVPFMIQIFLIYYLLPFYGIRFPAYVVGVIGLALYSSAYFAEIIRAGILSLSKGQLESGRAIGMTRWQAMRLIVFPQLPSYVIPPFINQSASLVKESSILSTITVHELTMVTQRVQLEFYVFVEPLLFAACLYLVINGTIVVGLNAVKNRLYGGAKAAGPGRLTMDGGPNG